MILEDNILWKFCDKSIPVYYGALPSGLDLALSILDRKSFHLHELLKYQAPHFLLRILLFSPKEYGGAVVEVIIFSFVWTTVLHAV